MYEIYKHFIDIKETQSPINNEKMLSFKNFICEIQRKTIMINISHHFVNVMLTKILKCDHSKGLIRMLKLAFSHTVYRRGTWYKT